MALSFSLLCVFILLIKFVPFKVKNVYVHSNYFFTFPFLTLSHTSFFQFLCGVRFLHSWLLLCDPLILTRTFCVTSWMELFIRVYWAIGMQWKIVADSPQNSSVANISAKVDKTLRAFLTGFLTRPVVCTVSARNNSCCDIILATGVSGLR